MRTPAFLSCASLIFCGFALGGCSSAPVRATASNLPIERPSQEEPTVANPRFAPLTMETLNDEQRRIATDLLQKYKKAGLGGPFHLLLRSPGLLDAMNKLTDYLHTNSSVPMRLNELVVLVVSRTWDAQYLWFIHGKKAVDSGISPEAVEDIKFGRPPHGLKADEMAVYKFCVELNRYHAVRDSTFRRVRKALSEQQIADLTAQLGLYSTIAMVLNASETEIPGGGIPPLQPLRAPASKK